TPQEFVERARGIEGEVGKMIVGHREVVRGVMIAILAGGHVLLEGVPGLGKTLLVRTLAQALRLEASRVQFTPDLMPADLTGTNLPRAGGGGPPPSRPPPRPSPPHRGPGGENTRPPPKAPAAAARARAGGAPPRPPPLARPARAVPGPGDPEPDRDGGHLPAA